MPDAATALAVAALPLMLIACVLPHVGAPVMVMPASENVAAKPGSGYVPESTPPAAPLGGLATPAMPACTQPCCVSALRAAPPTTHKRPSVLPLPILSARSPLNPVVPEFGVAVVA